jgi:hypothetical protein
VKAPARRFDLLLSVADLDAAAWLWTAITGLVQPLDLTVPATALPDLLQAAAQAGLGCMPADDGSGDHVVTIRPGLSVVLRAQPEAAFVDASPTPPPGRLVRRLPRAEAPRAKRPERKNPEAGRAVPESSARAPRRIVRPRGQVRKGGKK